MDLYLYNVTDSVNTINKVLKDERYFDITFKDSASITNPKIVLKTKDLILYNYAFIPDFKRYYFINSIIYENNNLVILELECDVLESFKTEILDSMGIISRTENGNPFFDGGDYLSEVRKNHEIYNSDVTFELEENIVISTFGGVEE